MLDNVHGSFGSDTGFAAAARAHCTGDAAPNSILSLHGQEACLETRSTPCRACRAGTLGAGALLAAGAVMPDMTSMTRGTFMWIVGHRHSPEIGLEPAEGYCPEALSQCLKAYGYKDRLVSRPPRTQCSGQGRCDMKQIGSSKRERSPVVWVQHRTSKRRSLVVDSGGGDADANTGYGMSSRLEAWKPSGRRAAESGRSDD